MDKETEEFVEAEYEGQKAAVIQEMMDDSRQVQVAAETPDIPTERPYKLPKGVLFLYEGKVGEMFFIPVCNKVVRIESVGWGTVNVFSPATGATAGISPTTEVVPFDSVRHAEFAKKVSRVKPEKEEDAQ